MATGASSAVGSGTELDAPPRVRLSEPQDFTCPTCEAAPRTPCVTKTGRVAASSHADRQWLAVEANRTADPDGAGGLR
jgi:hypothetical protein